MQIFRALHQGLVTYTFQRQEAEVKIGFHCMPVQLYSCTYAVLTQSHGRIVAEDVWNSRDTTTRAAALSFTAWLIL